MAAVVAAAGAEAGTAGVAEAIFTDVIVTAGAVVGLLVAAVTGRQADIPNARIKQANSTFRNIKGTPVQGARKGVSSLID